MPVRLAGGKLLGRYVEEIKKYFFVLLEGVNHPGPAEFLCKQGQPPK